MPKRAWSLSSLFVVGVPTFIPPLSSMSPALQRPPFTFSFSSVLPPDSSRALHQTTTVPACPTVIAIVMLVIIVVANSTFNSSSYAEMVANIQCPDALHTLVVYGCHEWWQLALMLTWAVWGRSGCRWGAIFAATARHVQSSSSLSMLRMSWWLSMGIAHGAASFKGLCWWWG